MADVYLILGAEGAGRREVVRDLIEGGFADDEIVAVGHCETEPDSPADEQLAARATNRIFAYATLAQSSIPEDAETAFLIAPGRGNPIDAVEDFSEWLSRTGHTLARIVTVVHCMLVSANPKLELWHRACIHFSDAVLLNRRLDVPNKWLSDFRLAYEQERFPCLFELVKKGRVANPALILEPQPRRLSLAFDDDIDPVDLIDFDEDDLPEETIDLTRPLDPWFVRLPSGQRERHLVDIARFLPESNSPPPPL
ncbi:hypothetical protein [Cerasicoccus arenae]|uniref:Uncharacterized protein n=1 Tax=Cerasicoccus arenae TaxID=424488 RepID=A0A8J3D9Y7_9BACT|nr:hypothetical protein [Cerasicoccus arenae]MBK1859376.1 hypothetical protein [Cerasicoccus arenae]GHB93257.1 hypothetical protein GCM10007047_05720 [Cerasicoccus arenae]